MSARAIAGNTAVMDQEHETVEGGADGVSGSDEFRHVVGLVLVAHEGTVERIDDDDGGGAPDLVVDGGDEGFVISNQVDRNIEQIERGVVGWFMALTPRLDAAGKPEATFECEINDGANRGAMGPK